MDKSIELIMFAKVIIIPLMAITSLIIGSVPIMISVLNNKYDNRNSINKEERQVKNIKTGHISSISSINRYIL